MSDRVFFSLIAVAAATLIGLSAIWPQGLGARSPWPFGHPPVQETPAMQAAMAREAAKAQAKIQAHQTGAVAQMRRVAARPAATAATPPANAQDAGLRVGQ